MRMHTAWIAALLGVAACTGADGNDGTNGTNGTNGNNGTDGNTYILSETAKHGLDIAPVALDLTGLDGAGIEKVGQGSYLVNAIIDCSGCHGDVQGSNGYLAGGIQFPIDGSGDYVVSRNIAKTQLSETSFMEVMHTGKDFKATGERLFVMPWQNFRYLADGDLSAIYAYLQAIPAVSFTPPADNKGSLASSLTPVPMPATYADGEQERNLPAAMNAEGQPAQDPGGVLHGLAISAIADFPNFGLMSPEDQARFGRGSYIVNAAACNDCHTRGLNGLPYDPVTLHINTDQWLSGGQVFVLPPGLDALLMTNRSMSANLEGPSGFFAEGPSFPTFEAILTTGTHADDPVPMPLAWPMPWDHFQNMAEEDLVSLYTYLMTLENNEPRVAGDKPTQMAAMYCTGNTDCTNAGVGDTCHMDATFGNECVGQACDPNNGDRDCGACQHCDTNTNTCVAPDSTNGADQGCVFSGI